MAMILWNKDYTETLAMTLDRFRRENPDYINSKITYAGRLDPMAEGLVILLTDEDVHAKDDYLSLDKTYDIDFILGVETDSYDILGRIQSVSVNYDVSINDMKHVLVSCVGKRDRSYPPFSSKPVQGKPLFQWFKEGSIDMIDIPKRMIETYSVDIEHSRIYSRDQMQSYIRNALGSVAGDFRQDEIMNDWENYFNTVNRDEFHVYTIRVRASSGTYMRSLVHEIGYLLKTRACTIKIKRLEIGPYHLDTLAKK